MTLSAIEVRSQQGTVTATVELDPAVFGVQPNVPVMHQVVTAQLAAARAGTQSTKTRAEVSGGGAKPYRQKGTGRARQGSTRAPHYAGGGVALGPKPRSYRQRTPRKMVQLALRGALSDRAAAGQVAVVESWDWEVPSTKDALAALETLELTGRVLVVLSRDDERAFKSFRNLPGVDLVLVPELNAYDVLCSDWVVFTRGTLPGNSTWGEAPVTPSKPALEAEAGTEAAQGATGEDEAVETTTGATTAATTAATTGARRAVSRATRAAEASERAEATEATEAAEATPETDEATAGPGEVTGEVAAEAPEADEQGAEDEPDE
jgi:large subunit ribosomal protein L4